MHSRPIQMHTMVFASFFSALMIIGAYIKIPVGPVPIVLTNMFVLLSGLVLGSRWGLASTAVYLLLGALGMPVFSAGGGIALFAGPTGGYLAGYALAAWVTGSIIERTGKPALFSLVALITGAIVIYVPGVFWLKHILHLSWPGTLAVGVFPFLPGDGLKIAGAYGVFMMLRSSRPELILHSTGKNP